MLRDPPLRPKSRRTFPPAHCELPAPILGAIPNVYRPFRPGLASEIPRIISPSWSAAVPLTYNSHKNFTTAFGYLVGLQRRNRKDTSEYIQQAAARTDWEECPVGIAASEKSVVPRTRVVEVAGKEPGVRQLPRRIGHGSCSDQTQKATSWIH